VLTSLLATPLFASGDAKKGEEIFEQCSVCHYAHKVEKKMGPGLKGVTKKEKLHNGEKATEANILKVVNTGGNGMPAYKDLLTDQERENVMAYLKTL